MKNFVKKMIAPISGAATAAFVGINTALAQDPAFMQGQKPDLAQSGDLGSNITVLINYALGFLGLIAVVFLVYAGVLMVTAGGNEEQTTKARKVIMYAVIGIVIILLSYTIVAAVTGAFGG